MSAPAWLLDAGREYAEQVEEGLAGALPAGLERVARGRLPGVRAAVRGALEAAGEGGGPVACRHVLADALDGPDVGGPTLCVRHPGGGLFCGPCMDAHCDGHQAPVGVCDGCGGGGRLRPMVQPIAARSFVMRKLDGGTTLGTGPLLVEGLTICSGCVGGGSL
jgi:hypothetical protein